MIWNRRYSRKSVSFWYTPGVTSSCHCPPMPCLIEWSRWVLPAPLLPSTGTTSEWVIGSYRYRSMMAWSRSRSAANSSGTW